MAAFFRSESFCDGCDAPSCAAGDGITSGGACGARDPKQLRRAVDLGHLAWNRAEVFGLSSDGDDSRPLQNGVIFRPFDVTASFTLAAWCCGCGTTPCQKLEGIEYDVRQPRMSNIRRRCDRRWRFPVGYIICGGGFARRKIDEQERSMSESRRSSCGSARVLNRVNSHVRLRSIGEGQKDV